MREADALGQFAALLSSDDRFAVPQVVEELTKKEVLTMTYMKGQPIETVFHSSGTERNRIARNILELNLNEVFIWGVVQTDPNFANYRYEKDTGVIQLLDFGATRFYNQDQIKLYQMLMKAAIEGENSDIIVFAEKIGYLLGNEPDSYKNNLIDLLLMVSEPFRARDSYDFGRSDLAVRMQQSFFQMRLNNNYGTLPPVDVLFLHRKLAGLYLLLSQLQAKLPIRNNNLVNEIIH